MTQTEAWSFELLVGDIIEKLGSKNEEELEQLSHLLHTIVESAFLDFCDSHNIEDYDPRY